MPISIKNDQTEEVARNLAKMTGESLTDAIRIALEERYERLRRAKLRRPLAAELTRIALRCASRPKVTSLSDDEILGYDEQGVPTR